MHLSPPVALTIAGSDCSAGAGIQADLKTFQHFRVHGLTAVTCVVSETANLVRTVFPVPVHVMVDQISLLLESFPVAVVKTGMLFSAAHVDAAAEILSNHPQLRVVVDPVMIASTGASLLEGDAIDIYRKKLLPLAYLITPNLPEAESLLGCKITHTSELDDAAKKLSSIFKTAVLLKGGHLQGDECIDVLADEGEVTHFQATRIDTHASHGTGCTLSAAIASRLAHGDELAQAVATAKLYLGESLIHAYSFTGTNREVIHALNQGTTI